MEDSGPAFFFARTLSWDIFRFGPRRIADAPAERKPPLTGQRPKPFAFHEFFIRERETFCPGVPLESGGVMRDMASREIRPKEKTGMERPLLAASLFAAMMTVGAASAATLTADDVRWDEPTRFAARDGARLVASVPCGE